MSNLIDKGGRPRRVNAAVIKRVHALRAEGLTQKEVGRQLDLATETVRKICSDRYPMPVSPLHEKAVPALFTSGRNPRETNFQALVAQAAPVPTVPRKFDHPQKLAPTSLQLVEADPPAPIPEASPEDEPMLLRNETLSPAAKKHFKLFRSPFVDDIQSRADVFTSTHGRYVRAALMDAAMNHGFIAIVGESGSGKSTLREELEERIREENKSVLVIRPYVIGMEPSDARGKMLRAGAIAEAIVATLAPNLMLKSSPQARYRQVHDLLKASRAAGYCHLVVIEEAHRMPLATLKHLKNYMELKDGLRRLLGVCLIGQPELQTILTAQNPEVREIVQRCEQIAMEPLDADLQGYLEHKFSRAGAALADVVAPDALDALRERLVVVPRGGRSTDAVSVCYPLVVNNLVCRAMNAAAAVAWPKVDAQVIAGC